MKTYQSVLFDLDGTLLDTADDLGAALNFLLNKYHLPLCPPERYRPCASNGSRGLIHLGFGEALAQFDFETLKSEFLTYYENNIDAKTILMPYVEDVLNALNERNVPWGVMTNKPGYLTESLSTKFPIFESSQAMICGDTLPKAKPDPSPLLYAMGNMHSLPQHGLYVGDAERDIQAGNAAFMDTAVVLNGFISSDDNPDTWNATHLFKDLRNIKDFI